ncbi:uncharacterized protein DFR27_0135 [Umboniibacter marinipuniceus]|uniref:S1 motif domain-containing protein n=1 Tax=Umboniibacter marinipuniceus TaxID=569599 RepID=A0A3M0ACH6_9GAMM|nr:Tex family protein [Umboniibacter marinipuniceus]RMA82187.1 uncharacterized protein DFR27_0135 [Umboniibacter marinipuniceus]
MIINQVSKTIAAELAVRPEQVHAAVTLLDQGDTVPFISRYRKEVTGGLDDSQMRQLEERLRYLRELNDRRASIIKSIDEQGKLSPQLEKALLDADTKSRLEDLYLPFKKKRRTKGQIAIEAGLAPLADQLLEDQSAFPEDAAAAFLSAEHGINSAKDALDGAKFILMERWAEQAGLIDSARQFMRKNAIIRSLVVPGQEHTGAKFSDYFDHHELLEKTPSHRALAMLRGRNEGILALTLVLQDELDDTPKAAHPCEALIRQFASVHEHSNAAKWLGEVVRWCWRIKLAPHIETDLMNTLRERAELDAIGVFANNLKDLLLAAPAGPRATLGLDPGLRTGVKCAVIDTTGKVLDHGAIFPNAPQNRIADAAAQLTRWIKQHGVELIAIGNGTASRETERFVRQLLKAAPELNATPVIVNESGASIYSASEFASRELPDLDVTIRGAVSIARRLQDPLAELVKIDPKSIGVGQYQHDVSQLQLARQLDAVVEDCVNSVGVDLNTASEALLARVAGLNTTIAANIVTYRHENGSFDQRNQLKKIARLGPKAFEQAAGFLRVNGGKNPLDRSGVHPESYGVVKAMAAANDTAIETLIGNAALLRSIALDQFVSEGAGLVTLKDIVSELEKPGRDPRPEFRTAALNDSVETMKDLKAGQRLEGTVTNVTNFGAFVDIGVHQDGLVHISALADKFVSDPREVVKAGDIVTVKVIEVDIDRKRIALSMKMGDSATKPATSAQRPASSAAKPKQHVRNNSQRGSNTPQGNNAMAAALAKAMNKR